MLSINFNLKTFKLRVLPKREVDLSNPAEMTRALQQVEGIVADAQGLLEEATAFRDKLKHELEAFQARQAASAVDFNKAVTLEEFAAYAEAQGFERKLAVQVWHNLIGRHADNHPVSLGLLACHTERELRGTILRIGAMGRVYLSVFLAHHGTEFGAAAAWRKRLDDEVRSRPIAFE